MVLSRAIKQQPSEKVGSDIVVSKKALKICIALCCVVLIQLIIIICLANKKPEPVIKEVEVIKTVELIKEVPVEVPVEVPPTLAYDITSEEREMLARLVYLEANTESLECQKAIVSVIFNRLENGYWGNYLQSVVYAPNQFSPANYIWQTTPTETNYQAVDEVLKFGTTIPQYVLYFRANYHFDWIGYKSYQKIDTVCFGYLEMDKQ
jgi:hypothetical protein